ncbi:MAG: Rne/Rng family ribonuclease [Alphaproteobacteria bacterium]|nr:Rne/Rng family ribonuclease [Alphaproteobacteria bacterium]
MTKTMLIDAAHPEEVRVCVLENGKVEDFDFESSARKPLRGNIYLARVTRVEPSLQAAFVEYGGNRHGFLAFNEIHPDYYQIPVSDRRLLQEAEAEEAALAAQLEFEQRGDEHGDDDLDDIDAVSLSDDGEDSDASEDATEDTPLIDDEAAASADSNLAEGDSDDSDAQLSEEVEAPRAESALMANQANKEISEPTAESEAESEASEPVTAEQYGGDDDAAGSDSTPAAPRRGDKRADLLERYKEARRKRARLVRNYKIQEVIKRRQILLVQVVKEERGNKGAALTTYLSLAGRYCVLMPNTARGGGISRKIPVAADRKRLRRVVDSLEVPQGMGLIIRTAGAKRTKAEIKRDYDYLIRLWENIRALTLKSIAPCLIYEEASLIKRAIRDLYDKDIDRILVEGDFGYREAKDFMKMLMPSHAKNVQPYKEKSPLFIKYGVESQLDAMYQPVVRLKSGGYLVIHQTEALVAIDVNSGKATRERNIELTALKTNLEAAKEAARQCRLRDLAGLVVIDFIDMEENKNNRAVEKRLKDALKSDRARIQVGRISNFGLLEMSRQRRRSGIVDGTTHACPTCNGAGVVRSNEMAALRILRAIEGEAIAARAAVISIKASLDVTMYILNHKREWLKRIEDDYALAIEIVADPSKAGDQYEVEKRGAPRALSDATAVVRADTQVIEEASESAPTEEETEAAAAPSESAAEGESGGRRRRRRRRKRRDDFETPNGEDASPDRAELTSEGAPGESGEGKEAVEGESAESEGPRKRRRRGRRGGRRNRRGDAAGEQTSEASAETASDVASNGEERPDAPSGEPNGETRPRTQPASESEAEKPYLSSDSTPETVTAEVPNGHDEEASAARQSDEAELPTLAAEDASPAEKSTPEAEERRPSRKGWWQRPFSG